MNTPDTPLLSIFTGLLGADRVEDWEEIAKKLGFNCKVYPASKTSKFPYTFPISFLDRPRYNIIVELIDVDTPAVFPLEFPFTFGEDKVWYLQKIFEIIKPADCAIIFNYSKSKKDVDAEVEEGEF